MPTNVTPQYRGAEARYRAARTREEKLEALEEMLRIMPKHKGTGKLQADVKARIAKLRQAPAGHPAHGGHGHTIPLEGTGPAGAARPEAPEPNWTRVPGLAVVTGMDRAGAGENLEILKALWSRPWPLFPVSSVDRRGFEALAAATFSALGVIRVCTKEPGRPVDREKPFTLKAGANVAALAETIHREFSEKLRFGRIWGKHVFDGQQVRGEHVLEEGDVVELHF